MAPKVLHVGDTVPRHDVSQPALPVWPRIWGKVSPHFQTDWRRIGRITLITLVVVAILLSPTYVPLAWNCHFRFVGTSQGCFSNCAKDGIFPGSLIWVKKAPAYKVGNFISYGYRETYQGQTPEHPNNPEKGETVENTVHPVKALGPNGWVFVGGMNPVNSDPDHWVPPTAIHGKVVGVFSWLPESYWEWVTMGWTLKFEDASARIRELKYIPMRCLTWSGRMENLASLAGSPANHQWSGDRKYVVANCGDRFRMFHGTREVASGVGRCCRWEKDRAVVVTRDSLFPADEKVWYVAIDGTRTPAFSHGQPKAGATISSASPSLHNPGNIVDGFDNTMWGIEASGPRIVRLTVKVARHVEKLQMVSSPVASLGSIILRVNGRVVQPKSRGMYPGDVEDVVFGNYRIVSEVSLGVMVRTIEVEICSGKGNHVAINEIHLE